MTNLTDEQARIKLAEVGLVVASEVHGISSWMGEARKFWARFNVDPKSVPIIPLREHLTEVLDYDESHRPDGCIWIIALIQEPGDD